MQRYVCYAATEQQELERPADLETRLSPFPRSSRRCGMSSTRSWASPSIKKVHQKPDGLSTWSRFVLSFALDRLELNELNALAFRRHSLPTNRTLKVKLESTTTLSRTMV